MNLSSFPLKKKRQNIDSCNFNWRELIAKKFIYNDVFQSPEIVQQFD